MFVKTVKLKKPNPIAFIIIAIAIIILVVVWATGRGSKGVGSKYKLENNTDRVSFLEQVGWEVSDTEKDCRVVKVPSKFNAVYNVYNKLQKEQGFDISKIKGKEVEIYEYEVYNYPDKPKNVVVHLIICDTILVGGDVSSTEKDGFMHGLMPVDVKQIKDKDGDQISNATEQSNTETSSPETSAPSSEANAPETSETSAPSSETSAPETSESSAETTSAPETSESSAETTSAPTNADKPSDFFFTTP